MDARVKDGKAKEEEERPLLTTGPKVLGCETLLNSKFQCGSFLNPDFQSSSVCSPRAVQHLSSSLLVPSTRTSFASPQSAMLNSGTMRGVGT